MPKKNLKSKIDWFVVSEVRKRRLAMELSQDDIAVHLELSKGYIGHIESPNFIAKYNIQHLNEIAKLLECSPKDFFPELPL